MDRRSAVILLAIAVLVIAAATALTVLGNGEASAPAPSATDPSYSTTASDGTTATPTTTTTTPPATLPPGTTVCDRYESVTVAGAVAAPGLVEASGLAAGRVNAGVLWSHNDSRDGARVYAIGIDGADLGSFDIGGAHAFDWEDMAISADSGTPYLYLGDIGDNFAIRSGRITVYRVPEPDLDTIVDRIDGAVALEYTYPDGMYNAEALFVADGSIYIVTKDRNDTRVYRGDATGDGSTTETLELVATLDLDAEVSGADISWDGKTIALRGYRTVWLWHRPQDDPITDVLAAPPCTAPSPEEIQGESIGFLADGAYATTSEGTGPILHIVPVTR